MRRSTDNLIALQFLAVILPVSLVLLGQLLGDARRATTLAESRPLRNLASEARANYRTFINGVADAVDSGTLSRNSAVALQSSAQQLERLAHMGQARVLGDTPALVHTLAGSINGGARMDALLPLRPQIMLADQQTRAIDEAFVQRDQAVVRSVIDSARLQQRLLFGALLLSGALTVYFVLLTRRRLRQQIEADAAVERARRAELETLSIRFAAASRAARAGVYELQANSQKVWWSETMNELYGHEGGDFCPTLSSWLTMIHPEDREAAATAMQTALRDHQQLRTRYRVVLPDGAVRHIESLAAAVVDSADGNSRLVGIDLDVTERVAAEQRETALQQQLRDASRHAGMAEVAASVLHNVGNVLNSVNVSASLLSDGIRKSKAVGLERVVALLDEHRGDLAHFIGADERGRHLPAYLEQLARQLSGERAETLQELDALRANIEHIKEVVAMQQSYAKLVGVSERVDVHKLVEESLRLNADELARQSITLRREFDEVPPVTVDKHRVLQILVNLLRNAKHACQAANRADKCIDVRVSRRPDGVAIAVTDNGVGIPAENLTRIFSHGFTTKRHGHGFGLHSGALAARELGGALRVESPGAGHGATFTLELPTRPSEKTHGH